MPMVMNNNSFGDDDRNYIPTEDTVNLMVEAMVLESLLTLDDESKVELIESGTLALCEKSNLINRKTIVKLNKNDDIDRRQTMAAMAIAREKNDPLWGKFLFYRMKSKELKSKMKDKYSTKSLVAARVAQKDYIKRASGTGLKIKTADLSSTRKEFTNSK